MDLYVYSQHHVPYVFTNKYSINYIIWVKTMRNEDNNGIICANIYKKYCISKIHANKAVILALFKLNIKRNSLLEKR